jgi:hypothetical protein
MLRYDDLSHSAATLAVLYCEHPGLRHWAAERHAPAGAAGQPEATGEASAPGAIDASAHSRWTRTTAGPEQASVSARALAGLDRWSVGLWR